MKRKRDRYPVRKEKKVDSNIQFYKRRKKIDLDIIKEIAIWVAEISLVVVIAVLLVFYFGFRVPVVGDSMSGTLENGDQILVNRFIYKMIQPKADDVIVFFPNGNRKSHYYIKRVIAVPGDTVQIKDGDIYVNEEAILADIDTPVIDAGMIEEIVIAEDEYFVIGDDRNNSEDSRYANIGNVKKDYIEGKAWLRILPFKKIGRIK